jgi:MscS family membrane protein
MDHSAFWQTLVWGIPYHTWAVSLSIAVATILFKAIVADVIFGWVKHLTSKTAAEWDDKLVVALKKPTTTLLVYTGLYASLAVLPLPADVSKGIFTFYKVVTIIMVFWGGIKALGVAAGEMAEYGRKKGIALATFIPLFKQITMVVWAIIALITIMETLGYSVGSIIAALGIGGAALAFASQTTIANLYGSIAIALDRPFKVGDIIKIGTTEGTVEAIGLRSTSIRTFAKTVVSIPNNTIANEAIENYSEMPHRRIVATVGLVYGTPAEKIDTIIADLKSMLAGMKGDLDGKSHLVHVSELADSAINIELICYTTKADIQDFYRIRQQVLMNAMAIVLRNGSDLAFPTQTVHLVQDK